MRIRLARTEDGPSIRTIYNAEVTGSQLNFDIIQWTVDDEQAWLARHQGAHPAVVAVDDEEQVLGFGSLSRYRNRPAYATTVEDSVYVDRLRRSGGVGKSILGELVRLAGEHGFHTVIARVVGHNEASIALHRSCGFEVVGVEKEVGRKHGQWLDVVELQRML